MEANGGQATLEELYNLTKDHKPDIDQSTEWKAGIRGVLFREIRNGRNFKKLKATQYSLA